MSLTVIAAMGVLVVVFLAVAASQLRDINTVEDYFLAARKLKTRRFMGAYIGTNVTFTAVFLYLTAEGVKSGNIPFAAAIFWLVGIALFWSQYHRIEAFCKSGHTLHEYLGQAFASTEVRRWASIITAIVFVAGVGLEFYGFAWLLEQLSDGQVPWLAIGLVLLLIMVLYTMIGGFPATVATDLLQVLLIIAGVGFLVRYAMLPHWTPEIQTRVLDLSHLTSDPVLLLAYMLIFVPFQFSVMDGWQRNVAAGGSGEVVRRATVGGGLAVAAVFAVPVTLGVMMAVEPTVAEDPLRALVTAVLRVPDGIPRAIVIGAFMSSLFSTADTLLLNAAYSVTYDLRLAKRTEGDLRDIDAGPEMLTALRAWVGVLGLASASVFAILFFVPLSAFILGVLSAQSLLGILVLYHFVAGSSAKRRARGAKAAIITGFVASVALVAGGLLVGDQRLVDGAPVAAVVLAIILFFVFPRSASSDVQDSVPEADS